MQVSTQHTGDTITITLEGRFDFSAHRVFRSQYEATLQIPEVKHIALNMAKVEYLDSSALGMLLLLNEGARASNIQVAIVNCPENVMKILNIANFGRIFKIS
ncbi:MAG TPA: STAS domain-containing protein [Methylophilaceae bacterium]